MAGKNYEEEGEAKEGKTSPRKRQKSKTSKKEPEPTVRVAYELKKADMVSLKKINPEDWNNIPIPVCVALETYQAEIMTLHRNLTMIDTAFK